MSITKVEFFKHNIEKDDIKKASKVLTTPFLSSGKMVEKFERKLAEYLGVEQAVCTSSCTAALHLSLLAFGIGEGDKVATTPMTFMATSNSILYTGASPVFVDVDKKTGLFEPYDVPKVQAVIPVHLYGQMCDMDAIDDVLSMGKMIVIEDAAHCLMKGIGQKSNGACVSFYPTKEITSGEGGAFVTNNVFLADKIRSMRNHGMTKAAYDRYNKPYQHWDMSELGYNCRMSDIQASLLIGQLERIVEARKRRCKIWGIYKKAFKDNKNIGLIETENGAKLMFTILVRDRDKVIIKLQDNGIGIAVNYRPVHLLDYYRNRFGYKEGDFPNAEYIGNHTITLPLYSKLTDNEAEYVIEKVNEAVNG